VILMEQDSGTGNSFLFSNGILDPAQRTIVATNETYKVNWMIQALGN